MREFLGNQARISPLVALVGGALQSGTVDPALPRAFGDYILLEELERGGMGIVYKAEQLSLKKIVALKMILPGGQSSADIERFLAQRSLWQAPASIIRILCRFSTGD